MQIPSMRDYAKKRSWVAAAEVQDVGSGAKTRLQREKLIEAARRREIDLVLVWRLDRWGRSLVALVNTLQELNALDVGFVSLSGALDLTTPSVGALTGMLAVFAEFERDILRDRVKARIDQARKDGKSPSALGSVAPQLSVCCVPTSAPSTVKCNFWPMGGVAPDSARAWDLPRITLPSSPQHLLVRQMTH